MIQTDFPSHNISLSSALLKFFDSLIAVSKIRKQKDKYMKCKALIRKSIYVKKKEETTRYEN